EVPNVSHRVDQIGIDAVHSQPRIDSRSGRQRLHAKVCETATRVWSGNGGTQSVREGCYRVAQDVVEEHIVVDGGAATNHGAILTKQAAPELRSVSKTHTRSEVVVV